MKIENHSGIWYVNHKRLGHDPLSELEISALNEFIKEYKVFENERELKEARESYFKNGISFNQLARIFDKCASEREISAYWKAPTFDRPAVVEGKTQEQRDKEFNDLIQ